MFLIALMIAIGTACLVVCYKMTDSIFATTIYGVYIILIITLVLGINSMTVYK